jgi:hypothetical protein
MSQAVQTQLISLAMMVFFVGLGMRRRMRPQPVRANRIVVTGGLIVLLLAFGLVGTGGRIVSDPVALVLVPVFLVAGAGLGFYLVRTMTFWTDESTGQLWMRGTAIFALILVGTIALRMVVGLLTTGSLFGPQGGYSGASGSSPAGPVKNGLLSDLSADLLFLTLGLWAARAFFLVQRYRDHAASRPAEGQGPA